MTDEQVAEIRARLQTWHDLKWGGRTSDAVAGFITRAPADLAALLDERKALVAVAEAEVERLQAALMECYKENNQARNEAILATALSNTYALQEIAFQAGWSNRAAGRWLTNGGREGGHRETVEEAFARWQDQKGTL